MIRLDQFLKLTGEFETGGQAKLAIQGGEVMVNGELETRRRRQLFAGDTIEWNGEIYEVELTPDEASSIPETDEVADESVDDEEAGLQP